MMDDGFGHWLAGFIDGEGYFAIHRGTHGQYVPRFVINLRDDDSSILLEVHQKTGLGSIYYRTSTPSHLKGQPQVWWRLGSNRDCLALVDLLERYPLRAKKKRDFEIWATAVRLKAENLGRPNQRDWPEMEALFWKLRGVRAYVPPKEKLKCLPEVLPTVVR